MRVYIWGTGRVAGKVVGRCIQLNEFEAFIDNDPAKKEYMGKPVIRPKDLIECEYDAILVANLCSKEIYVQCVKLGIDINKVVFLYGNIKLVDVNQNYDLAEKVLGTEYTQVIKNRYHVIRGVEVFDMPMNTAGLIGEPV